MSASKIIFQFNYLGHELTVTEDSTVSYKGETFKLWQAPIPMRNDIDIAYMRRNEPKTETITVPQLKAGMIVSKNGGRFRVLEDARPSRGHLPSNGIGPTDCAVAMSECIEGTVPGYFWPGSEWKFQGNQLARVCVEVPASA